MPLCTYPKPLFRRRGPAMATRGAATSSNRAIESLGPSRMESIVNIIAAMVAIAVADGPWPTQYYQGDYQVAAIEVVLVVVAAVVAIVAAIVK